MSILIRRKKEKEAWQFIKPLLDLPPCTDSEGQRQRKKAQRLIQESVKDPLFCQRILEHKATLREMLTHDFDRNTFQQLFNTDIRICVYDRQKKPQS